MVQAPHAHWVDIDAINYATKYTTKVPFTRVRTNFCTDKTCTVLPCVYTAPEELDELLNG